MVLKHSDDDGDLSIITAGDSILIACDKGHFWQLQAKQQTVEHSEGTVNSKMVASLESDFGPGARKAFRILREVKE